MNRSPTRFRGSSMVACHIFVGAFGIAGSAARPNAPWRTHHCRYFAPRATVGAKVDKLDGGIHATSGRPEASGVLETLLACRDDGLKTEKAASFSKAAR